MMTIHELLEDKTYREWFLKPPPMPVVYKQIGAQPWRVYLQIDERWRKKDAGTYREAFGIFKDYKHLARDAAIVSKSVAFSPPHRMARIRGKYVIDKRTGKKVQVTKLVVWSPKVPMDEAEMHTWCPYCRRPTVFKYFSRHHAFTGFNTLNLNTTMRCTICGIRREGLPRMIGVH